MNVRVRLFAAARQHAGRDLLEIDLPEEATVGQLRRRLAEEFPQIAPLAWQAMFAVAAEYAHDADAIRPAAEIAWIPPVSGG